MKHVTFHLTLQCRDDVAEQEIRVIGAELVEYAESQYGAGGFDAEVFADPPLEGEVQLGPSIDVVQEA